VTAGGAATLLVPGSRLGELMTLAAAPDGTVFVLRSGSELLKLVQGDLAFFTWANPGLVGQNHPASQTLSLGFRPDGTTVFLDALQGLMAVAP